MTREPQSEYEKVLNKAKSKYRDAVRGFECQEELLKTELNLDETIFITKRKNKFLAEFTILEDVFGLKVLNENN